MENNEIIEVVKSTALDLENKIQTKLASAESKALELEKQINAIETKLTNFNPMQKIEVKEEKATIGDTYAMITYAKAIESISSKRENQADILVDYASKGFAPAKMAISLMLNPKSIDKDNAIEMKHLLGNASANKSLSLNDITSGAGFADPTTDPAFAGWLQESAIFPTIAGVKRRTFIDGTIRINKGASAGVGYWMDSTTTLQEMGITFAQEVINAKKVGGILFLANDMLRADVRGALTEIQTQIQRTMGNTIDSAFINGSGSTGIPTGLLNISGVANVAAQGTPTAKKIGQDLRKANTYMSANNVFPANPTWLINPEIAGYIKDQTETTGAYTSYARELNERGTLLNIPVIETSKMPNTKALLFDASRVVIGESYGLIVEASNDFKFANDQTALRAISATNIGLEFDKAAYVITGVNTWNV